MDGAIPAVQDANNARPSPSRFTGIHEETNLARSLLADRAMAASPLDATFDGTAPSTGTFPALTLKYINGEADGKIIATWQPPSLLLKGLVFFQDNQYVKIPNANHLNFSGRITIEAWVKPLRRFNDNEIANIIAHGYESWGWTEVYLRICGGGYEIGTTINYGPVRARYQVPDSDEGAWVHLAGLFDGGHWKLYRNGDLVAETPWWEGAVEVNSAWAIGAKGDGTERFFKGQLQEIRIWACTRSQQEICDNMYKVLAGDEEDLVGYWRLDEGKGNTANDLSPNKHHGQIFNATWASDEQSHVVVDDATYDVELLDAQGNRVGELVTGATDKAEFIIQNPQDNSSFTVKVRKRQGESLTDWSPGTSITIKPLVAPSDIDVTLTGNSVAILYNAVAGATGYVVQALDIISDTRVAWKHGVNTKEWSQKFTPRFNGSMTNISFDRTSRPYWEDPPVPATMCVYEDNGKLLASARFLDCTGKGRIAISGRVQGEKEYTCKIIYDNEVLVWYGTQGNVHVLPALIVEGMRSREDGTLPEINTAGTTAAIDISNLIQQGYQIQVKAIANESESAWSGPTSTIYGILLDKATYSHGHLGIDLTSGAPPNTNLSIAAEVKGSDGSRHEDQFKITGSKCSTSLDLNLDENVAYTLTVELPVNHRVRSRDSLTLITRAPTISRVAYELLPTPALIVDCDSASREVEGIRATLKGGHYCAEREGIGSVVFDETLDATISYELTARYRGSNGRVLGPEPPTVIPIVASPEIQLVSYDLLPTPALTVTCASASAPGVDGAFAVLSGGRSPRTVYGTNKITFEGTLDDAVAYEVAARLYGNDRKVQGPASPVYVPLAVSPVIALVSYNGPTNPSLTVTWTEILNPVADGYVAALVMGDRAPVERSVPGTSTTFSEALPSDVPSSVTVRVHGAGGIVRGPRSAAVTALTAPVPGTQLCLQRGTDSFALVGRWAATPGVSGYRYILRVNGASCEEAETDGTSVAFQVEHKPGIRYSLLVRAIASCVEGPWCAPAEGPFMLSATATYDALGRLRRVSQVNVDSTEYTLDAFGNITAVQSTPSGDTGTSSLPENQ